jgi:hypothetical protein
VISATHATATHESLEVKNGEQQQRHLEQVELYNQTTIDAEGKQSQEGHQSRVEQHEVHPSLLQEQQQSEEVIQATGPVQIVESIPDASSVDAIEATAAAVVVVATSEEPAAVDVEISEF